MKTIYGLWRTCHKCDEVTERTYSQLFTNYDQARAALESEIEREVNALRKERELNVRVHLLYNGKQIVINNYEMYLNYTIQLFVLVEDDDKVKL